jgi:hypothetical protein
MCSQRGMVRHPLHDTDTITTGKDAWQAGGTHAPASLMLLLRWIGIHAFQLLTLDLCLTLFLHAYP